MNATWFRSCSSIEVLCASCDSFRNRSCPIPCWCIAYASSFSVCVTVYASECDVVWFAAWCIIMIVCRNVWCGCRTWRCGWLCSVEELGDYWPGFDVVVYVDDPFDV